VIFIKIGVRLLIALSSIPFIAMSTDSAEAIVWSCEASGSYHSYKAEAVERGQPTFALSVYASPDFDPTTYQEVLQIVVQLHSTQELIGVGELSTGEIVRVQAFVDGGVAFQVEASDRSIGRCVRDVTLN